MKARNYRSSIPRTATEVVEQRFDDGSAESAYYYLDGDKVGYRQWEVTGDLLYEYGMKDGKRHGRVYRFFPDGQPLDVMPYRNGLMHGIGKQWGQDGKVVIAYKMIKGTGLDLWCSHVNQTLSEERYWPKDGELGYSRDWNDDEHTLTKEYHYVNGKGYHGIWREWNEKGKLRRGYPHFFLNNGRVTKSQYLKACNQDVVLPPYRKEDDQPFRELPREYVSQRKR